MKEDPCIGLTHTLFEPDSMLHGPCNAPCLPPTDDAISARDADDLFAILFAHLIGAGGLAAAGIHVRRRLNGRRQPLMPSLRRLVVRRPARVCVSP